MQGIVKDDNGAYVKAAIIRLLKVKDAVDASDDEAVTYAETDEEGRFVIGDLEPEARYILEVHIEIPEKQVLIDEHEQQDLIDEPETPEIRVEQEYPTAESAAELAVEPVPIPETIIDSLKNSNTTDERFKVNLCINSLNIIGFDPKEKQYLWKNSMW